MHYAGVTSRKYIINIIRSSGVHSPDNTVCGKEKGLRIKRLKCTTFMVVAVVEQILRG